MGRRPKGFENRIKGLMQRQCTIRFEPKPMECDAEIEAKQEDGTVKREICGCKMFDRKEFYHVFYLPKTVSPEGQPRYGKQAFEHYMCLACGKVYKQSEWNKRAQETFTAENKKIIDPNDMKPDDNGKGNLDA